jgi:peptidyl-prolyl cis-trans isomerase D
MRNIITLFVMVCSGLIVNAQKDALAEKFAKAKNDSAFVIQHSVSIPHTLKFEEIYNNEGAPEHMRTIMQTPLNGVVGPVMENGRKVYYKVVRADSTISMHVAHIIVSHSMHPNGESKAMILDAFDKLKSGATWTSVVDEYGEDGSVQSDGDLGWFTTGQMVPPFEEACLKMKKDDKTIVETIYGWHIIWMKSNSKKTRASVECMVLIAQ